MRASRDRTPGWARARSIFRRVFAGPDAELGRVVRIGAGLGHDVYAAQVHLSGEPERSGRYTVSLPRADGDADADTRTRREFELLRSLSREVLRFRIPTAVALVEELDRPVMVRSYLEGAPLEFRRGRSPGTVPWDVVADVAAALHAIDVAAFRHILAGHATRRDHALAELSEFEGLGDETRDARAWVESHLPPATPAALVHGDLLGQNILVSVDQPPALLDWEYATTGDPAFDLAIVTRGRRRPFQTESGLARLLAAYEDHGGARLTATEVHLYELCLAARWYRLALDDGERRGPAAQALAQLRGILARARAMENA